jgi:hypothetical protein
MVMVYTLSIIFQSTQSPIADSYAVSAARKGQTSYGTIRSLGSLGTALGGYAGGLYLSRFEITQLWMPFLALSLAGAFTVLTLSKRSRGYSAVVPLARLEGAIPESFLSPTLSFAYSSTKRLRRIIHFVLLSECWRQLPTVGSARCSLVDECIFHATQPRLQKNRS